MSEPRPPSMEALAAGSSACTGTASTARRARLPGVASVAVLRQALGEYRGHCQSVPCRRFDFGGYMALAFKDLPDAEALVAESLEALARCLLRHCPSGIVNQRALATVLLEETRTDPSVVCSGMTAEQWAEWSAGQSRVALSHLRTMALHTPKMRRRCKGLETEQARKLQALVALVDLSAGADDLTEGALVGGTGELAFPGTGAGSAQADVVTTAGTAAPTPRKRRPTRQASTASDVSLDFASLARSPLGLGAGCTVRITPNQVGLLIDLASLRPRPPALGGQGAAVRAQRSVMRKPCASSSLAGALPQAASATPAAAQEAVSQAMSAQSDAGEAQTPAAAQEAVSSPALYTTMWYKKTAAVGVRERGGKQLFQIRVAGATREELTNVAARLIGKLEQGTNLDTVKALLAEEKAALQRALGSAPNVW